MEVRKCLVKTCHLEMEPELSYQHEPPDPRILLSSLTAIRKIYLTIRSNTLPICNIFTQTRGRQRVFPGQYRKHRPAYCVCLILMHLLTLFGADCQRSLCPALRRLFCIRRTEYTRNPLRLGSHYPNIRIVATGLCGSDVSSPKASLIHDLPY